MKVILYDDGDGGVGMISPCDPSRPIHDIALQAVPEGRDFLIVDQADLPENLDYRDAWQADFSDADGQGLGHEKYRLRQQELNAAWLYRKATPEEMYRIGPTT